MTSNDQIDGPTRQDAGCAARRVQAQRSALWAAYGDALGWISELTDAKGLARRTGGAALVKPVAWQRRIGGRSGVTVTLPQGCYSDDSQLRLATSRAIRPDGFDVEAFSKVELPVWLSYALGGGKSTTSAALNLTKPSSVWYANRFKGWTNSGGNGAAMRIQPHVWATYSLHDSAKLLPDVVRNSICTHSHPTGLMGAALHALALAHAMAKGSAPSPDDLWSIATEAARVPDIVADDFNMANWRTAFESEAGAFEQAWASAVAEAQRAIEVACSCVTHGTGTERYARVLSSLELSHPKKRGSGMLTAVAATLLPWCEARPEEGLGIAANALGTDTDTIATMAGAIFRAVADCEPPVEVLDAELFRAEALRLTDIAFGREAAPSHRYPDLIHWDAPKARADMLAGTDDGAMQVVGLGPAEPIAGEVKAPAGKFAWRWIKLAIGQTLLIKHRLPAPWQPARSPTPPTSGRMTDVDAGKSDDMFSNDLDESATAPPTPEQQRALDMQRALQYLDENIDDDICVGRAFRRIARKGTTEQVLEFTAAYIRLINGGSSGNAMSSSGTDVPSSDHIRE